MSDIPNDVLLNANRVWNAIWEKGTENEDPIMIIAEAIMAERGRHGWQPIATVPKDGTIIDLLHKGGFRVYDEWLTDEDGWAGGWMENKFTHWMKSPIAKP